jgi:predicted RNase H-like HicB family nuclease
MGMTMTHAFKVIVEQHPDGYVAYPLGLRGVVVGEGDTYEAALVDVQAAIAFHIETFGVEVLEDLPQVLDAFVADADVVV